MRIRVVRRGTPTALSSREHRHVTVRRVLTVGALAALAAGLTSAPAKALDPAATWDLKGTVTWKNPHPDVPGKPVNFLIALCTQTCVDTSGPWGIQADRAVNFDGGDASNGNHFWLPSTTPAAYRVALEFSPRSGSSNQVGYLLRTTAGWTLTKDYAKASTDVFTQSVGNASFLVNIPYTPPPAPPAPPPAPKYPKAGISYVMLLRNDNYSGFRFTVTNEQPSTVVRVTFTGCGGPKKPVYAVDLKRSKTHTYTVAPPGNILGPNYTLTMRVSETGATPRTFGYVAIKGVKGLVCPTPR